MSYTPCEVGARAAQEAHERSLLRGADLPEGTEHMTLDSYHPGPGTAAAFRFACEFCEQEEPRRGVVFAGTTGCGKTHLAVAILRHWVGRGRRGLFRSVPNLMEILRIAQLADDEDRLWETLQTLRLRPLLVLDDLGTEKVTDTRLERLFQIVNDRELTGQPLIVTCNYPRPAALAEHLGGIAGERIVSRLRGICEWVEMDGPDGRVDRWWERP
jgi:DNA replication protein DnaC